MRGPVVILIAIACAACAPTGASASATCAGADTAPTTANASATHAAIACLVDAARAERGVPALRRDARLRTAAQRYAAQLDPRKPLSHRAADGSTPLDRIAAVGYGGGSFSAAETLGRANGTLATPAERVRTWLGDASTRRLLLGAQYRDIGVGTVTRGATTTFVVEIGRRRHTH